MIDSDTPSEPSKPAQSDAESKQKGSERREIPGGLPYTTSPGVLKKVLEGIITAERPDKFSSDFMSTILHVTGGSARAVPPLLKRMGFIAADGSPTEIYSRFKSDSARSSAALEGLRKGFAEIFRRNDFAHRADSNAIRDLIVEITGLTKSDPIVKAIIGTFQSVRDFVDPNKIALENNSTRTVVDPSPPTTESIEPIARGGGMSLVYNINVVLPETTNVQVFNAIFRSLRENLLDGEP